MCGRLLGQCVHVQWCLQVVLYLSVLVESVVLLVSCPHPIAQSTISLWRIGSGLLYVFRVIDCMHGNPARTECTRLVGHLSVTACCSVVGPVCVICA